jgi:hypothetical protein
MTRWSAIAVLVAMAAGAEEPITVSESVPAPARAEAPEKIRDNLFLLEEAYNQEPGVIQHIQAVQVAPVTGRWTYSFTEEWPVPTDRHQVSVTVPLLSSDLDGRPGLGDLLVNYRLQVLGMGGVGAVAFAPRLSLAIPTGDYRGGFGRGMLGIQANLPLSIELGRWFVTHLNAGMTLTPAAKAPSGAEATAVDVNAGGALVFLAAPTLNVLVEAVYLSSASVLDQGGIERDHTWVVNPGLRFALNFDGLQVVPGISVPVTFSSSGVGVSLLAYLSIEHTLWKAP